MVMFHYYLLGGGDTVAPSGLYTRLSLIHISEPTRPY